MHEVQVVHQASLSSLVSTYFASSTGNKAIEGTLRFLAPNKSYNCILFREISPKHHKHNIRRKLLIDFILRIKRLHKKKIIKTDINYTLVVYQSENSRTRVSRVDVRDKYIP
ncbi:unnamed protein product [Ixodes pacificus]